MYPYTQYWNEQVHSHERLRKDSLELVESRASLVMQRPAIVRLNVVAVAAPNQFDGKRVSLGMSNDFSCRL